MAIVNAIRTGITKGVTGVGILVDVLPVQEVKQVGVTQTLTVVSLTLLLVISEALRKNSKVLV